MATGDLDALLERMPKIAEAINSFSSEAVQAEAFAALIAAFEGKRHTSRIAKESDGASENVATAQEHAASDSDNTTTAPKATATPRKKRGAGNGKADWSVVHTLNLKPDGKQSFEDFIEEKQPKSNEDKYVVAVYYLEEILGVEPITKNEVGTMFRLTKSWKEPAAVVKGMQMTSHRKATLNTSDIDNIKITPQGRNFVEHSLPVKPKGKK